MEIERINENTIKFYISYLDIEDRGFEREEIWYNRERSEQLFWQMMDEINQEEDFTVEGPLWIQVQALEKGLEIVVTKAQLSKDGENLQLPIGDDNTIDLPVSENIEEMLEDQFGTSDDDFDDEIEEDDGLFWLVVRFNEFEDVIQLSHYFNENTVGMDDTLYSYKGKYYLYIEFSDLDWTDDEQEDIMSKVLEFGQEADITIHVLEEYGKEIFEQNTFEQVREYFEL